jgi:hypothetical protein
MRPDKTRPLRIFIGYDSTEVPAYHVLCHSILSRSSIPVSITPIRLSHLGAIYQRERSSLESTEFSITRWLTPYLADYSPDPCVFMDCDMLVLDDIANVLNYVTDYRPVYCVKHNHKPTHKTKMRGAPQTRYDRKNWSSFMVFWPGHMDCRRLTPLYVEKAQGLALHQFKWVQTSVGRIGFEWNHLVGYDEHVSAEQISCLHWTEGGPWWPEYAGEPYAQLWFEERDAMLSTAVRRPDAA